MLLNYFTGWGKTEIEEMEEQELADYLDEAAQINREMGIKNNKQR